MGRYVALLRGINVGGKNSLPMKALVAIVEGAGGREVRTYVQSGNVVLTATPAIAKKLPALVQDAIAERLGLRVPVVIRTAEAIAAVARDNPFLARGDDPDGLHVAFLAQMPAPDRVAALDPARSPPDELAVRGSEIYLRCPDGIGRSKLTVDWLDRQLATTSTIRNWRTVLALADLAASSPLT